MAMIEIFIKLLFTHTDSVTHCTGWKAYICIDYTRNKFHPIILLVIFHSHALFTNKQIFTCIILVGFYNFIGLY